MKKLLIYVLPFMLAFYSAHAYASDTPMHSVVITVTNIINQNGKIQIGLYNSPEKFSNIETSFRGVAIDIESEKLTYVFKDIPTGVYAVSVFHDENSNSLLDKKNLFGIPKEGYGFSNNIRPKFRGANFEESQFIVETDTDLTINLGY